MPEVKSALGRADATMSSGGHRRRRRSLFGGLEERRRAGAELLQQGRLIGLGRLEVAQLDVAEAADLLRDGGKPDRDGVVVGVELREDLVEYALVVLHQRPLGLALERIAERIERAAA